MKTRLSIDTDFEFYRAIIARTQNSIADDDFIVHRGDINKPAHNRCCGAYFFGVTGDNMSQVKHISTGWFQKTTETFGILLLELFHAHHLDMMWHHCMVCRLLS